jgi:hypothetical protein
VDTYGDECLSHTKVSEWFKRVKDRGREMEDNPCLGQPCTSKIDANIEQARKID